MNWKMVVDERTFDIVVDEAVDEGCWNFWTTTSSYKGYGSIASTRKLCMKNIYKKYEAEVMEKEQELKRLKKNLERLKKNLK